jgi:hypothetical protein
MSWQGPHDPPRNPGNPQPQGSWNEPPAPQWGAAPQQHTQQQPRWDQPAPGPESFETRSYQSPGQSPVQSPGQTPGHGQDQYGQDQYGQQQQYGQSYGQQPSYQPYGQPGQQQHYGGGYGAQAPTQQFGQDTWGQQAQPQWQQPGGQQQWGGPQPSFGAPSGNGGRSGGKGRSKGPLIGGIAGGLVLVLLAGGFFYVRSQKDDDKGKPAAAAAPATTAPAAAGGKGQDGGGSGAATETTSETTSEGTSEGTGDGAQATGAKFDVPLASDGDTDPADWPDACKMLTDAEVRSILPGVKKITKDGAKGEFLFGGGKTPHNVTCDYEVPLASDPYPDLPSKITVDLRGVGDADAVKERYERNLESNSKSAAKFPDQFADYGSRFGSDACFYDGSSLECRTGTFDFWVSGRTSSESGDYQAAQKKWREETLGQVVGVLSQKMR